MNTPNGKLKEIGSATMTAMATSIALSKRGRFRYESDISRMKIELIRQGETIVDDDFIAYWKGLEACGVGKIVYGRNGGHDKFVWHYNLKTVGKAIVESDPKPLEPLESAKDAPKPAKVHHKGPKPSPVLKVGQKVDNAVVIQKPASEKVVFISLSSGDISIKLPANLSKDDVQTITRAILSALAA